MQEAAKVNKEIIPTFSKARPEISRVTTMQQVNDLKQRNKDKMIAILFWASWYPECEDMRKTFAELAETLHH